MYLQHHFRREEIAEEFGIHRPTVERELSVAVGKQKEKDKGSDHREKEKRIRTKSENSTR